jgi:hypothetical protein
MVVKRDDFHLIMVNDKWKGNVLQRIILQKRMER